MDSVHDLFGCNAPWILLDGLGWKVESHPQILSDLPSQAYLIGVFDLWRFEQRTNGNRLGGRVWILKMGATPIY